MNGYGFNLALVRDGDLVGASPGLEGNGLLSIGKRAKELSGEFEIITGTGQGTTVMLRVPVEHRLLTTAPVQY